MTFTMAEITSFVGGFFWPFIRIGSVLIAAPLFGARNLVPKRLRIAFALALTWMIVPMLPPAPAVDPFSATGLMITLNQIMLGLIMGFFLQLAFSALVVGGHNISMTMGLGFAQFLDPQNGVSVPVLSQLFMILGTLLFFVLNGHLVLFQVMYDSFTAMPVGSLKLTAENFLTLVLWGGRMFVGAFLIALPAVITITLINIAFGVMTRAAPTLNIFSVGFPTTMIMGFVILVLTVPVLLPHFTNILLEAFDVMQLTLIGEGQPAEGLPAVGGGGRDG